MNKAAVERGLLGFMGSIPGFGGITNAVLAKKSREKEDRMAGLEAINREKIAQKEKDDLIYKKNQALMDAATNTTLASEAAQSAAQIQEQGRQASEQIKVKGAKTLGSQSAMLAATGQTGAGSATGLQSQTAANTAADVETTLSNAASEAGIYSTKAEGYTTLATTLGEQATAYEEAAEEIEPEDEYNAYIDAYYGKEDQLAI